MPPSEPPKEPGKPANGDAFVKEVVTAEPTVEDVVAAVTGADPEEIRNRFSVWIFRAIIALIVSTVPPATSFMYGLGTKNAELGAAAKKRDQEVALRKRQLQKEVLLRVVDVAKEAEMGDPKSLYRLGIIATMVNENSNVFGLKLNNAETTLQRMLDRLSPISGLRDRVKETKILIAASTKQIKEAEAAEVRLWKDLRVIRRRLENKKLSKRQRFLLTLQDRTKDRELAREQVRRAFYAERLQRNLKLRDYFSEQLERQVDVLKDAMKNAERTRERLRVSDRAIRELVERLQSKNKQTAAKAGATLQKLAAEVVRRHLKAKQDLTRLHKDLRSEQNELRGTRQALNACLKAKPRMSCPDCPDCPDCPTPDSPTATSRRTKPAARATLRRVMSMTPRRYAKRKLPRPPPRRRMAPPPPHSRLYQLQGLFD